MHGDYFLSKWCMVQAYRYSRATITAKYSCQLSYQLMTFAKNEQLIIT